MVAAWSSSGSIRMLALEARSSGRNGRRDLSTAEGWGLTTEQPKARESTGGWAGGLAGPHSYACALSLPDSSCLTCSCRDVAAGGIPITPSVSHQSLCLFPRTSVPRPAPSFSDFSFLLILYKQRDPGLPKPLLTSLCTPPRAHASLSAGFHLRAES